ncbi:hypothetical protein AGABI1DRAFT_93692 [Agaricus bisporus var. burnettii JB137-S8]|uniref:DUF6535 domain-containing protein n=1 Tax=Agaricus bisporus var. burnettii (strain JB137-S8 / ATCC MYA-4627 / FGSC 10392) TaxID=597362 RepID=K5XQF7_AGABU|nr:uncharacterized protein AGABI1DRAFT_93692 [Agaricus bisporus var. burnettii JB137-S8]EKM77030.1 hypothetical protein AGABI1DRAFT_93692 [Agaricus bisporus var. burnettii JB137-S8]
MSGTLFSGTLRRNNSRYQRVATTDERQFQGEWLCDEPYKYSVKSSNNPLEMGNEVVERHDENVCRQLKEEINFLMVVAGLFLAIVATFSVESYKLLQEDKQDTMSELLVKVVRLLTARWYTYLKKIYSELNFQFLRCVRHLIDIRLFNDLDVMSATAIVRSESAASMTLSKTIQTLLKTADGIFREPNMRTHTGTSSKSHSPSRG